jgi:hypothetical protein
MRDGSPTLEQLPAFSNRCQQLLVRGSQVGQVFDGAGDALYEKLSRLVDLLAGLIASARQGNDATRVMHCTSRGGQLNDAFSESNLIFSAY